MVQFLPIDRDSADSSQVSTRPATQAKNTVYEISGISDIVRGQVDPREKASQSRIKAAIRNTAPGSATQGSGEHWHGTPLGFRLS